MKPADRLLIGKDGILMSDLISREAVIELIRSSYPSAPIMRMNKERWEKKYKPYIEAEKAVEMLPSAEPEAIRCKDCKHWYKDADSGMSCEYTEMSQPEDGFCNWAERKEE